MSGLPTVLSCITTQPISSAHKCMRHLPPACLPASQSNSSHHEWFAGGLVVQEGRVQRVCQGCVTQFLHGQARGRKLGCGPVCQFVCLPVCVSLPGPCHTVPAWRGKGPQPCLLASLPLCVSARAMSHSSCIDLGKGAHAWTKACGTGMARHVSQMNPSDELALPDDDVVLGVPESGELYRTSSQNEGSIGPSNKQIPPTSPSHA
jgi:hypothetical protein